MSSDKRTLSSGQLNWIAGLVEGEGSIRATQKGMPIIRVAMTDQDVIQKLADLWQSDVYNHPARGKWKPIYETYVCSSSAAGWMMTLYTLMGQRRKEQIRKALTSWRAIPAKPWLVGVSGRKHGQKAEKDWTA